MKLHLSSRFVAFAAVAATALGLAAGAAGTADAATHTSPWLTGSQMPQKASFHWQAEPGTRYTTTGEFQWLYTCGYDKRPAHELGTSSISVEQFGTKAHGVQGSQVLFHFSSAAKAKTALKRIEADYATCVKLVDRTYDLGRHVHAAVERTAWVQQGVAYRLEIRNYLGRPANTADIPSDAQEFFVQRGNTISFVNIEGGNRYVDVTKGSRGVLKAMAARLG